MYPAFVSENVDPKYTPAICASLERFFLLHIGESFQTGRLTLAAKYSLRKGTYGELFLEGKKEDLRDLVLLESKDLQKQMSKLLDEQKRLVKNKSNKEKDLNQYKFDVSSGVKRPDPAYEAKLVKELEEIDKRLEEIPDEIKKINLKTDKETIKKDEDERVKERERKEKGRDKRKKGGSYEPTAVTNLDFIPTMMKIKVKVRYIGGPNDSRLKLKRFRTTSEEREIVIGCQIVAIKAKNISKIYNVLIDDYYANKFTFLYRAVWRFVVGHTLHYLKRIWNKIPFVTKLVPDYFGLYKDILLSRKGLIDSSSFNPKKGSAKHYRFSSAIVIMDSTDIDTDDTNFFENQAAIKKLYSLGWNSFATVDHPNSRVIFCSQLDRGLCSVLPYAYMFHALKAKEVLDGLDPLSRQAGPFKRKKPPMRTFARKFVKENLSREFVRQKLEEYD